MLIHALQWKLNDVEAAKELAHRKKATIEIIMIIFGIEIGLFNN